MKERFKETMGKVALKIVNDDSLYLSYLTAIFILSFGLTITIGKLIKKGGR